MSHERYASPPVGHPYEFDMEEVENSSFMFLGQVIEWIIWSDPALTISTTADLEEHWSEAESKLFKKLDCGRPIAQGYRAPGFPSVPAAIEPGFWARMNRGGDGDPVFSPVDQSEKREDGGSIWIGKDRWDGVRVPTAWVQENWPRKGIDRIDPVAASQPSNVIPDMQDGACAVEPKATDTRDFSHSGISKMQAAIHLAIQKLFPEGRMPARSSDRNRIIRDFFEAAGETPPSERTIERALAKLK